MKKQNSKIQCAIHEERLNSIMANIDELKILIRGHVEESKYVRDSVIKNQTGIRWIWGALVLLFGSISVIASVCFK